MSKTSQRRRTAYANGYKVGRYGWAHHVAPRYRTSCGYEFSQGLAAGRAARPVTRRWKSFSGPKKARPLAALLWAVLFAIVLAPGVFE